jgi:hypothetical protein
MLVFMSMLMSHTSLYFVVLYFVLACALTCDQALFYKYLFIIL